MDRPRLLLLCVCLALAGLGAPAWAAPDSAPADHAEPAATETDAPSPPAPDSPPGAERVATDGNPAEETAEPPATGDTAEGAEPAKTPAAETAERSDTPTRPRLGAADPSKRRQLPDPLPDGAKVMVIPMNRQFDEVMLFTLRHAFQQLDGDDRYVAAILEMDTPGGRIDVTKEIVDWILSAPVPVYLYVDGWAGSAGAITSFATDGVYMSPDSIIGAATPVVMSREGPTAGGEDFAEKMSSFTRAMARALAENKGYMPELAEAMIDRDTELVVGDRVISAKGKLLSLTANEAVEVIPPRERPLLADGIAADRAELVGMLGLADAELVDFEVAGGALLAKWLLTISPLLLLAGIMGLYIEIKTPGFGFPGTVGLICLGLFFFGTHTAGLSGLTEALLIVIGIILLIVELFLLPGFGVIGLSGLFCILVGIVLALIPNLPDQVPEIEGWGDPVLTFGNFLNSAMITVLWTSLGMVALIYLLSRYLPKTGIYHRVVLGTSASAATGYVGIDVDERQALVGKRGMTLSELRPAGVAQIEGRRVDVVSDGDYIEAGVPIEVVKTRGPRLEVRPVTEDA